MNDDYKNYLSRVDLIKNQVERERLREQQVQQTRKQRMQKQLLEKQQQILQAELTSRMFASVYSTGGDSSVDSDAQAFITAAAITDPTQQSAVNQLVVDLKGYGVWTKMKALYPFVGGTASQHKWNLKDPRDLDAAFRLVFNGGWTHSSTGATPNGTNGYADTFLTPSTNLTLNSFNYGYYSRGTTLSVTEIMGSWNNSGQQTQFVTNDSLGQLYGDAYSISSRATASVPNFTGFLNYGRLNVNSLTIYRNGSPLITNTNAVTGTPPNLKLFIAALNVGSAILFTPLPCAFCHISDGLNNTEVANLYTAVQTFQTALNRQV
jgi:hypothetical protein